MSPELENFITFEQMILSTLEDMIDASLFEDFQVKGSVYYQWSSSTPVAIRLVQATCPSKLYTKSVAESRYAS